MTKKEQDDPSNKPVVPTGKMHPVAALFPRMPEDELQELAEDIKLNGLLNEIVVDRHGNTVDGGNRQEACRRAGIQPRFRVLNGDTDLVAFIMSSNERRRHITKSQRAMIAAVVRHNQNQEAIAKYLAEHPDFTVAEARRVLEAQAKDDHGRFKCRVSSQNTVPSQNMRDLATSTGSSLPLIAKAAFVIEHAPSEVDGVIAGGSLDKAYEKAQGNKAASVSILGKLERLKNEAPDLSDQVIEERGPLEEAIAALDARIAKRQKDEQDAKDYRFRTTSMFAQAISLLDPRLMTVEQLSDKLLTDLDPEAVDDDLSLDRITQALNVLTKIAEGWQR